MAAAPAAPQLSIFDAAKVIFPYAAGQSAYRRLYNIIRRHERSCPVRFSYGRSAKGRPARYLSSDDLPLLSKWVSTITKE